MATWFIHHFWPRLDAAFRKYYADDGMTWAASLSYYAAFSFFPLVLVLLSGVGFVLKVSNAAQLQQKQLIDLIAQQFSPKLADQVASILSGVTSNAAIGGPIGLVTLVFGAIGIFTQLDSAFARIWKTDAGQNNKPGLLAVIRYALVTRLRAFLMLIGLGGLVLVAFVAGAVMWGISRASRGTPVAPLLFHILPITISIALNILFFTLIYRLLPKRRVAWKHAIRGGVLAGLAWEIGRQILNYFLIGNSFSAYGVVGSFIIMMLWFYYASIVLLFGAEFVEVSSRDGTTGQKPPPTQSSANSPEAQNEAAAAPTAPKIYW
jgi:membrane protein